MLTAFFNFQEIEKALFCLIKIDLSQFYEKIDETMENPPDEAVLDLASLKSK